MNPTRVRPYKHAELYPPCAEERCDRCPAGRANAIPTRGRCDCTCHAPQPPV